MTTANAMLFAPVELKQLDQWVLWRREVVDGKPTKVPYRVNGKGKASSTGPATWGSYEDVIKAYQAGGYDGIGFVFSDKGPYTGVDLDHCRDPQTGIIETWAQSIIDSLNSCSEITPSETGVHIILRGKVPTGGNRKGKVELYDHDRYFTITGNHLEGTPDTIEDRQQELNHLHAEIFPKAVSKPGGNGSRPVDLGDAELIDKAMSAANGVAFTSLWKGDTSAHGDDDSAADLALCCHLAFWTGNDAARIDLLFRQSGLYREKWERKDYRDRTIDKAIEGTAETYTPAGKGLNTPREGCQYPPTNLDELLEVFKYYLYLPDTGPIEIVLGAYVANCLPGDPVWLFLVAPPGYGKTELLGSLLRVKDIHSVAVLTEASLLSGTPKREAPNAKGGLLREMGEFGVMVIKDFGGILSLTRESRGPILAALREVYDGSWTRYVGSDGGKVLTWKGKAGLIGGATPSIDQHYAVMATLGERFSYYRLPGDDQSKKTAQAVAFAGHEAEMRKDLIEYTARFLNNLTLPKELYRLSAEDKERLVSLATFTARCRSPIERESMVGREITLIPGAESPTRLVKVLGQLLRGLLIVGLDKDRAWVLITKVALDSMPALRQKVILTMLMEDRIYETSELATFLDYPTNTTRRTLEDINCYQIVKRQSQGKGNADQWELTDWTKTTFKAAAGSVPEILKGILGT